MAHPARRPLPAAGAYVVATAGMAVHVLVVYWVIVLGGGALLDSDPPSLPLAVLATAVVAVTFEPVRRELTRRVMPSAYDVLSEFTKQVAGTVATEDLAPSMARLLSEGTGARRVEVWLRREGPPLGEDLAARWPPDAEPIHRAAPGTHCHDVLYAGEQVGQIVVDRGGTSGSPSHPVERRLLNDLLASVGLALNTLKLTADLQRRIEEAAWQSAELRASRQRIVTATDAARRRLERDIHDGAQQHLVALAVHLSLASTVIGRDPARAAELVGDLRSSVDAARATLAELSRGLYPRLLVDAGLSAALRAAWVMSPVPVHLDDLTGRRFPVEVECAAYFGCLEAVQNAVKHAEASRVEVHLTETASVLCLEVRDDGVGFDPTQVSAGAGLRNMRDRVESLGGVLTVRSRPREGTSVTGRIPVSALGCGADG